jgi:tetratricopeptide (TPR) repeat protein
MLLKNLKLIVFIFLLLYQSPTLSKSNSLNSFNPKYLSNYFSGIVAYENQNNSQALKFFNSSKFLTNQHDPYLKRYVYSLVLETKIQQAVYKLHQNLGNKNSDFFEAYLLLSIDNIKKGNFIKSDEYLTQSEKFINNDGFKKVIVSSLKQYLHVFQKKIILKNRTTYGNLTFINETFQRCYLDDEKTDTYFSGLINNDQDYSRYLYFYLSYLVENDRYEEAKKITDQLDILNSTILIAQGKKWIDENRLKEFNKVFSCKNHSDIVSEFLFIIANLYSSEENFEESNFYLNISSFLNPKFRFNLTLLSENYFFKKNYKRTEKVLKKFEKNDQFYFWYAVKKQAQIISEQSGKLEALNYIKNKFDKIEKKNIKIIFDIANFYKNSKKYEEAINYYNEIILTLDDKSELYADVLYRRGGSYERLGDYSKADKDLLKSIEIKPDDAYFLNYLAYSWLERNYKINEAMEMLEKAYDLQNEDPYIIDSIGWAYYLIDDFFKAEKHMKKAVQLMPDDPVVNDHYGDILWKLDRKIQARYFWKNVLMLEDTEKEMKEKINIKLIKGIENS